MRAVAGRPALFAASLLAAALLSSADGQGLDMSKGGPVEVTARDGIEWRQNDQVVIARGDARAVRGDVQVAADRLTAHYRKKANAPVVTTPVPARTGASTGAPTGASTGALIPGDDGGSNEIYRLVADGHVKIFNQTNIAVGDHAVYDIDQALLVLTGKDLSLTTPTQVMTARDTMEYWADKHMAVGRGLATVTTSDGRRLSADVLVAYTTPPDQGGAKPVAPTRVAAPGNDPLASGGKLQQVEAFGHVEVRTATETITGDRAVYVADTGIARIAGNVHITRGLSHLNGDEALVNMKTGISTLVRNPGERVQGLIVPNDAAERGDAAAVKPPKPVTK